MCYIYSIIIQFFSRTLLDSKKKIYDIDFFSSSPIWRKKTYMNCVCWLNLISNLFFKSFFYFGGFSLFIDFACVYPSYVWPFCCQEHLYPPSIFDRWRIPMEKKEGGLWHLGGTFGWRYRRLYAFHRLLCNSVHAHTAWEYIPNVRVITRSFIFNHFYRFVSSIFFFEFQKSGSLFNVMGANNS